MPDARLDLSAERVKCPEYYIKYGTTEHRSSGVNYQISFSKLNTSVYSGNTLNKNCVIY